MREIVRRLHGVVEPLEERSEGEQALVEREHDFRVGVFRRGC